MDEKKSIEKDIPQAAQSHLNMVQGIIERMSSNCTSCKTWCITLVSALMVVLSRQGEPKYLTIAIIPIALFFFLDSYYLSLEKRFRKAHDTFIRKLHNNSLKVEDLFAIKPEEKAIKAFFKSATSLSIWVFYLTLLLIVIFTRLLIF